MQRDDMDRHQRARRRLLKQALCFPVAVMVLGSRGAAQAGTASKEDFHYQDHPNEGKRCAMCTAFNPPPQGQALGTCNVVAGPVSADGWCMAFNPK
ncbi:MULTISPECIES: high-potential iron-sulfur protein [unclassified Massilia]|uniref:high-potential iron-sulfur protein n=1 Tax=unclassified Massilia TaxID=2609279 RepID=UPI000761AFD8|nr:MULTISPECIES: high-potential iron-sulfur protein [unclassified Massilia]